MLQGTPVIKFRFCFIRTRYNFLADINYDGGIKVIILAIGRQYLSDSDDLEFINIDLAVLTIAGYALRNK